MSSAAYPLLRRRRSLRLPELGRRARPVAIGLVAFAGVMAGVYAATRPEPVDPAIAIAAGRGALAAGNYNAARHNAQAALRSGPGSRDAQLLLARAYLELEEGGPAKAALARTRQLGASAEAMRDLHAYARLLQGDAQGALTEVTDVDGPYAERVRARALAALGRRGEARGVLERLVRTHPSDVRSWSELGRLLFSGGEVGLADAAAARAVALAPGDPVALTLRGELVRSRFGPVASLPWFEAALERDAYHYPALVEYAATLGELGRHRDMLGVSRAASLSRPGSAEPLYLQAVLAARTGKRDLARSLLDRAGSGANAIPGAMLLRSALDCADGAYERAIERWRALVRMQPMNLRARSLLAAALVRSGAAVDAAALLRPVVARADADPYALTVAARALEAAGDSRAAAELLDRAARVRPGAAGVFASPDPPAALAAAAAGAPSDPTYAVGLIRGLAGAGHQSALSVAQRLARAAPGAPDAQLTLGDAYAAQGRWGDAAAAYRRAADLRFDEPALLRYVDALGRLGRSEEAAGVVSLYLSQNPRSLPAQRLLGRWQLARGDWDAAVEMLEGMRARVGSTDASLLAELARAYAGDGDGVVAVRYGAAAYRLTPMSPAAVAAYAAALRKAGNADGARQMRAKLERLGRD